MNAHILPEKREGTVDYSFDSPHQLEWLVRDDPQLQAELNDNSHQEGELSSQVVNKVLARIKEL
jgi:hypothetical protein